MSTISPLGAHARNALHRADFPGKVFGSAEERQIVDAYHAASQRGDGGKNEQNFFSQG